MERIDQRIKGLVNQIVARQLSANETKYACEFPIKVTAREPIKQPDTCQRLLLSTPSLTCEMQPLSRLSVLLITLEALDLAKHFAV
jgi:hypothetical protein